ncbi:MAG: helix-turn-helix transcriptional regulator [Novosphingobium sp.]
MTGATPWALSLADRRAAITNVFVTSRHTYYHGVAMLHGRTQISVLDALTDKQSEVLTLVAEGLTSKEIARNLGISESAVNQRIETIRQRLGGMPRSQIARLHRQRSTLVMTIPSSNPLTGNPIALQSPPGLDQAKAVEGIIDHASQPAMKDSDVLQPSTIFHRFETALDRPRSAWARSIAILALAAGLAMTSLLVLSVMETLDALLQQ